MVHRTEIYIARQITVCECGVERIDVEVVFDTLRKARSFVRREAFDNPSPADLKTYRMQIEKTVLNNPDPWCWDIVWEYDIRGKLISRSDSGEELHEDESEQPYEGEFAVGDYVVVEALPWNRFSHSVLDIIGLVSYRPIPLSEWLHAGNRREDWHPLYTVDYIAPNGYLSHDHLCESALRRSRSELPVELAFLEVLRNHYLGIKRIPPQTMDKVYKAEIRVDHVPGFFSPN